MTKVCTAYTVCRILEEIGILETQKLKSIYMRVSRKAAFMAGTSAYLQTDNRISIYDGLCALMLPSGNDAAVMFATEIGRWLFLIGDKQNKNILPIINTKDKIGNFSNDARGQEDAVQLAFKQPSKGHEDYLESFIFEMNRQCQKLRLKKCKFINPHGLQQKGNHASANDIICLMNYAVKYSVLDEVMGKATHKCEVYNYDLQKRYFWWENTNKLLSQYFTASKTGITPSAGPCLISVFKFGPYESRGCLIDSKNPEIRWKEMATILLW
jgi:D-alanyl-D-alanine carboxypeptidase